MADHKAQLLIIGDYLDASKKDDRAYLSKSNDIYDICEQSDDRHTDLLSLLKSQLLVNYSIKYLMNELRPNQAVTSDLKDVLEDAQSGSVAVQQSIIDQLGWNPLASAPTASSSQNVQQVFDVPELAEMILGNLEFRDLASAAQVNRSWARNVRSSRKLQVKLCLVGDSNSLSRSIFPTRFNSRREQATMLDGLTCRMMTGECANREIVLVTARLYMYGVHTGSICFPDADSQCRGVLLCQPPIKEMLAYPSCCYEKCEWDDLPPPPAPVRIYSQTGLVVGDLLDAAEEMLQLHLDCPYASAYQHDTISGLVTPKIMYEGDLSLRQDDPRLPPVDSGAQRQRYDSYDGDMYDGWWDETEERALLRKYIYTKRTALTNGQAIPTSHDFRAMRDSMGKNHGDNFQDDGFECADGNDMGGNESDGTASGDGNGTSSANQTI